MAKNMASFGKCSEYIWKYCVFVCCWMEYSKNINLIMLQPNNNNIRSFCCCSVVSDSLWPHGLQHYRLPCPSLSPGACSNSCLLSQWCHLTILSSVAPFSSCPQSFPVSGSFPVGQLFIAGGQSFGVLASASVLSMNVQGWFPLGLTGLISFYPRDSQESSPAPQFESINFSMFSLLYGPALTSVHDYWKNYSLDYAELCLYG